MTSDSNIDWAILRTGGKQYRVGVGQMLNIERSDFFGAVAGSESSKFAFDDVLAVKVSGRLVMGQPLVAGARVIAELLPEKRGKKVLILKKGRRKNRRRKLGHRQCIQPIRVIEIEPGVAEETSVEGSWPSQEVSSFDERGDLASVIHDARSGQPEALTNLALRSSTTDWSQFPVSDRRLVTDVLRPHRADDWNSVGRFVARALKVLEPTPPSSSPQTKGRQSPGRRQGVPYQLNLQVERTPSHEKYQVGLRIRGRVLSNGGRNKLDGVSHLRLRPEFTVSGPGAVKAPLHVTHRNGLPNGMAADFLLAFDCKDGEAVVVLSVHIGSHTLRRFISPHSLQVSRTPPPSLSNHQQVEEARAASSQHQDCEEATS